jgi:hypothetical protein
MIRHFIGVGLRVGLVLRIHLEWGKSGKEVVWV